MNQLTDDLWDSGNKRIKALEEENAALREDKERLDYAIANGLTCFGPNGPMSYVAYDPETESDKRYWRVDGQRFDDARAAIDAARKEAKAAK